MSTTPLTQVLSTPRRSGASGSPADAPPPSRTWGRTQIGVTLVLIAVFFFVANFVDKAWNSYQTAQQVRALQSQINVINAQNDSLRQQIAYYQTKDYVVKVAREQLLYMLPGDTLLRVQSGLPSAPAPTP